MIAPAIEHATIKGIKADYVKKTITVTLEASLEDFESVDRDIVAEWAEMEFRVDVEITRSIQPAPLLDFAEERTHA